MREQESRTMTVAEALAEADAEKARYVANDYHGTDEYVDALERLVAAVRAERQGGGDGQ